MSMELFALFVYTISTGRMAWLMRSPDEWDSWGLVLLMIFLPVLNTALAVWSLLSEDANA